MNKIKVLFLCIHNSARSQMAEAFLNKYGEGNFEVESAGLEPGKLNSLAIETMKQEGIDISQNSTNDVFDFQRQGKFFDYVITVCDKEAADRCPVFPGQHKKIHWSFADPSQLQGTQDEKLAATGKIRDQIKMSVMQFIKQFS
jgi:arsenate reductase